ncbi:hypothetical protein GCM10011609_44310 [Lentzea pudingi]|uniref:Uncharacterized protein n=1 Tax=Lentzea pudingi TaxID=1789439 RepID=A0ABQ2I7M9_9PSEU|nr:hypothetical protein [Lentzea pudingi]GGN00900.1 hypothetical protein GCM10011609_44310 [Lentzea pudingi]
MRGDEAMVRAFRTWESKGKISQPGLDIPTAYGQILCRQVRRTITPRCGLVIRDERTRSGCSERSDDLRAGIHHPSSVSRRLTRCA